MKSSIYAEQSLNFWIIIELLRYRYIGLHINIITAYSLSSDHTAVKEEM